MSKQDQLDAIDQERHVARVLLVDGKINGLQFLARMRDIDAQEDKVNRRAFAVYMRILEQERGRKTKQSNETFAEKQRTQASELLAELQAKLAKLA